MKQYIPNGWRNDKIKYICVMIMYCFMNEEKSLYWAWEMTPMPCGLPSWYQILDGWKLIFRLKTKEMKK